MRLLRAIRAVLWSISGVRRGSEAARDLEATRPSTLIMAAGIVAILLVGSLTALVLIVGPEPREKEKSAATPTAVAPPKTHGPVLVRDTMEERAQPCTTCHGAETQATSDGFSPRIAGKPAGYLFNQLASFRDGRRGYAPMVYLVQYMSDDYLREMAAYFSRLD